MVIVPVRYNFPQVRLTAWLSSLNRRKLSMQSGFCDKQLISHSSRWDTSFGMPAGYSSCSASSQQLRRYCTERFFMVLTSAVLNLFKLLRCILQICYSPQKFSVIRRRLLRFFAFKMSALVIIPLSSSCRTRDFPYCSKDIFFAKKRSP